MVGGALVGAWVALGAAQFLMFGGGKCFFAGCR